MKKLPKFVHKGWGYEKWIANSPEYCGKLLFIKKNHRCSWHYHTLKDETFYLQSGKIQLSYSPVSSAFPDHIVQKMIEIRQRQ